MRNGLLCHLSDTHEYYCSECGLSIPEWRVPHQRNISQWSSDLFHFCDYEPDARELAILEMQEAARG